MARPKTDQHYVKRVAELAAARWSVSDITRQLEQEAAREGRHDAPSYRTVRRLHALYVQQPEAVRREELPFQWPEALQDGSIPWDSARPILDYVRWRIVERQDPEALPTRRVAKWIARLVQAAPSMPPDVAEWYAEHLAASEITDELGQPPQWHLPGLTERLALQGPWEDLVAVKIMPASSPRAEQKGKTNEYA